MQRLYRGIWEQAGNTEDTESEEKGFVFSNSVEYSSKLADILETLELIDLNKALINGEHTNVKSGQYVIYSGEFYSNNFRGSWGYYNNNDGSNWDGVDPTLIASNKYNDDSSIVEVHIQLRSTDEYIPTKSSYSRLADNPVLKIVGYLYNVKAEENRTIIKIAPLHVSLNSDL